ncbi:MAG: PH domain-containing protein [Limisphaerales bacterium]
MKAEFKAARWGPRIWVITVLVTTLLLVIFPALLFSAPVLIPHMQWLIVVMMGSIVGISALFLVRGYVINDNTLLVRRTLWKTRLDLHGIKSVAADPDALKGAWKTIGNDGLFAIHGWFWGKRQGKFRAFVTDPRCAVVLDCGAQKIVISPEDPEGFVNAIKGGLHGRD